LTKIDDEEWAGWYKAFMVGFCAARKRHRYHAGDWLAIMSHETWGCILRDIPRCDHWAVEPRNKDAGPRLHGVRIVLAYDVVVMEFAIKV
jgi:hypothetical protein